MQKLAILHLSDIHIKKGRNAVVGRVQQIANAVGAFSHEAENVLIIISGDIAFSGTHEEYEISQKFVQHLREALERSGCKLYIECVIVPGNHDCSFSEQNSIRDMFLANIAKSRAYLGEDMLQACLRVQEQYRQFTKIVAPALSSSDGKLFDSRVIEINGRRVLLNRCNTAWLSRLHEQQGTIFIPVELMQAKQTLEVDVCISIFHHPYNWLEAVNAREFRRRVEEMSDLIFTGHEHEAATYRRSAGEHEPTDYIEGRALQDSHDHDNSGFNVAILDFVSRSAKVCFYGWKSDFYGMAGSPEIRQFSNHSKQLVGAFLPSKQFTAFLDDPGARYTHPKVGYVTLEQIFTFPDFRQISETETPKLSHNSMVSGKDAFATISSVERVLITGTDKSGRTCLAKRTCLRLLKDARVPLFIATSKDSRKLNEGDVDALLARVFSDQYSPELLEKFLQLPRDRRAIVLDDFHIASLNRRGKAALIKRLAAQFGKIVILGDESLRLEDISSRSKEGALFDDFVEFQILELGRVLRDKIIHRWISLGQEHEMADEEFEAKQKQYAHAIDTVIGKSLIPAYPVFILVILQQLEAGTQHKTNNGSYGYFYEYLITQSLTGKTPGEVDLKYNFLSEMAWLLHEQQKKTLTELEYIEFSARYSAEYKIRIPAESIRGELLAANVLMLNSAGEILYRYKYNYYYFVARWLARNITEARAKDAIKRLAEGIHREEYANIIIFLSYLTQDPCVLESVLECSRALYADVAPCDMQAHTNFLNSLQERVPELVSEELDGYKSRVTALRQMDEEDKSQQESEESQVAELLKINTAFKTVDVLGQILKNYAGSMRGEQKMRVARECVTVALRSMNFLLNLLENNLEGFVDYLVEYYVKQEKIESRDEIVKKARQLIFFIANSWCVGVIKRLSRAAGSQQLEQVYAELRSEFGSVSMDLVEVSVRLDHFVAFPQATVERIHSSVHDNFFADAVLRRIVVMHFYLFPVDHSIRDAICNKLDIQLEKPKLLDEKLKKIG